MTTFSSNAGTRICILKTDNHGYELKQHQNKKTLHNYLLNVSAGGTVLFDMDQPFVNLQAEYIVVSHGGVIEIGTEDEPYLSEAQITLHGHVRSIELPIYGAKVLAVTHGRLDMHGKFEQFMSLTLVLYYLPSPIAFLSVFLIQSYQ